jgi:acetylglutamate kinase
VNLERVGIPSRDADPRLLSTLTAGGFVPVIACIGADSEGRLLNVNADTLAGALAAALGAERLVIAGTTPGVLDDAGATVPLLDSPAIARLVSSGTATAGMVAKLAACEHALASGAGEVVIVDGRDDAALELAAAGGVPSTASLLVKTCLQPS